MNRPPIPNTRRDAPVALLPLLLPLLPAAIVLALSALFSSPGSRPLAVVARLVP